MLITIILLLIPRKTSELVQLISKQSFYARNLYKSKIDVPPAPLLAFLLSTRHWAP